MGVPNAIICGVGGTPPEKEQEPIQAVKTDKRGKNKEGNSDPVELVLCHAAHALRLSGIRQPVVAENATLREESTASAYARPEGYC